MPQPQRGPGQEGADLLLEEVAARQQRALGQRRGRPRSVVVQRPAPSVRSRFRVGCVLAAHRTDLRRASPTEQSSDHREDRSGDHLELTHAQHLEQRDVADQHHQAGYGHLHQRLEHLGDRAVGPGDRPDEVEQAPAGQQGWDGRQDHADVRTQNASAVQAGQLAPQGEVGDHRADDVRGRRGHRGTHQPPLGRQQRGDQAADDDDEGEGHLQPEQPLGVLVGVVDPLDHRERAECGDPAEQGDHHGRGALSLRKGRRGQDRLDQGEGDDGERAPGEDGEHRDGPQPEGQVVAHRRALAGGGVVGHPGEQRGHEGHGDERLGQHVEEVRAVPGGVAGDEAVGGRPAGRGGEVGDRDEPHLRDEQGGEGPGGHLPGAPEARAAQPPPGPVPEPGPAQRDDEDHGLHHHPESGAAADDGGAQRRPRGGVGVGTGGGRGAEQQDVGDEADQRDEVVRGGGPHEGPEDALGVEHLPQQRVHAVEEQLGHAPQGEGDCQVEPHLLQPGGVDRHQHAGTRGEQHGQGE